MVRIGAIFIASCMVLIAASFGAVLFLRLGFSASDCALAGFGVLTVLALYNAVTGRRRDRAAVNDQVASLARGSGDLARQLAEFGRRLAALDENIGDLGLLGAAPRAEQPLTGEVEELSRLVRQLAESVAQHELALSAERSPPAMPVGVAEKVAAVAARPGDDVSAPAGTGAPGLPKIAAFRGLDADAVVAALAVALDGQKIELYLQPTVTLPQRKVRYYEAMSRLNAGNGEIIAAADFLPYAEHGALVPKLDGLCLLRCVQVVRRLLLKNRDIGLFCNLSAATLTDAGFPQLLELIDANRAIAPSLVFEFSQSAVRSMGPIEHESLAALAERGFRFSMDNLVDMRIESRELTARGFASSRRWRRCCSNARETPRRIFTRPISPTCWAASASISSPTGSRANRQWSTCSTTTCASDRAFCFHCRGRCGPKPCRALRIRASASRQEPKPRRRPPPVLRCAAAALPSLCAPRTAAHEHRKRSLRRVALI
jgi:cyclic-di-GMP phosphodiesterase, flagellum assembly factor TipF